MFTTEDRIQAWFAFLEWWKIQELNGDISATDSYYGQDVAGRAWLAAVEWKAQREGDR